MKRRRPSHRSLALSLALLFACTQSPADAFAASAGRPASDPATVAELSDALGMTVKQTQKLIRSTPSKNFERQHIVDNAEHILRFLTEERKIMSKNQAKKLIQKSPSMLTYTSTNIEQTTDFFLSECGLGKDEYTKMLMTILHAWGSALKTLCVQQLTFSETRLAAISGNGSLYVIHRFFEMRGFSSQGRNSCLRSSS